MQSRPNYPFIHDTGLITHHSMAKKEIGQADLGIRTFQLGVRQAISLSGACSHSSGGPTIIGNGLNCTKKT